MQAGILGNIFHAVGTKWRSLVADYGTSTVCCRDVCCGHKWLLTHDTSSVHTVLLHCVPLTHDT